MIQEEHDWMLDLKLFLQKHFQIQDPEFSQAEEGASRQQEWKQAEIQETKLRDSSYGNY